MTENENERLLVLSDLHISPLGPLSSFHAGPELAQFLARNARGDTTLVLAGDIFDFLQIEGRPSTLDTGLSEEYELKQLASIDHLRPGVDPTKLSLSSTPQSPTPKGQKPTSVPTTPAAVKKGPPYGQSSPASTSPPSNS